MIIIFGSFLIEKMRYFHVFFLFFHDFLIQEI